VRPFGFVMDYEGRLYFGIGKHKASYKQLLSNPNVEISTANKEGKWIRIKGKAVFDENKDALKKAFEILPSLKKMYNEETGMSLGLIYLEDIDAEFADLMTGQFEKITL
ncbi:pyridoxamine 5'-phosphate oxidase family protein, partial [Clostridioides difficile]|uniref:pyridoxamine 5'-phosphate oxidase family protein n=1 Tax=Clostridioides difficile TaxID=1496 RepID=UPI003F8D30D1